MPSPDYPALYSGLVFREQDDLDALWQRLEVPAGEIQVMDQLGNLEVTGVARGEHDGEDAIRLQLATVDRRYTGRAVIQAGASVLVERSFDPDLEPLAIDLDVVIDYEDGNDDPSRMVNALFALIDGGPVKAKVVTWNGPGGGHPIVRFSGPRGAVVELLKRYDPEGWEDLATLNEVEPAPAPSPNPLQDWMQARLLEELAKGDKGSWAPHRLSLSYQETPRRTPFNQQVRDGWTLFSGDRAYPRINVGRDLMKVLVKYYAEWLDLPEDFRP